MPTYGEEKLISILNLFDFTTSPPTFLNNPVNTGTLTTHRLAVNNSITISNSNGVTYTINVNDNGDLVFYKGTTIITAFNN